MNGLAARWRWAPAAARAVASPALQAALAFAVYSAVWAGAEALPLVLHPARAQLLQSGMDPNTFTWSMGWWPYAIGHGLNPLYSTEIAAPAGHGLAWVTTVPLLAVLAAPVTLAAGAVVSFNLLTAIAIPASGWAAFLLCRRLTQRFWPGMAGGAVYGFSAFEMNHIYAGQLNLAVSALLPLMAYLAVVWWQGGIGARPVIALLALAMAAQFYLFVETFASMTVAGGLALLAGYAVARPAVRPAVARLARLVGAAYLIAIVAAAPYLIYALRHMPPAFAHTPAGFSVDLAGLVIPRPHQVFGLGWLESMAVALPTAGRDGYVGLPLLVLAVAMAAVTWPSRVTRFLSVMAGFLIAAALGPVLHTAGHEVVPFPWARVWSLPLLRSAYPARFMAFAFLAFSAVMALWLAGSSRRTWGRALLAGLALAAIAANMPALRLRPHTSVPVFITSGAYRRYLDPGDTVVVVSPVGNAGMLWQARTGFYMRQAGGFLNRWINDTDLPAPVAALAKGNLTAHKVRTFHRFIRTAGIQAIIVQVGSPPAWQAVLGDLGLKGQESGGVILYRTGP